MRTVIAIDALDTLALGAGITAAPVFSVSDAALALAAAARMNIGAVTLALAVDVLAAGFGLMRIGAVIWAAVALTDAAVDGCTSV